MLGRTIGGITAIRRIDAALCRPLVTTSTSLTPLLSLTSTTSRPNRSLTSLSSFSSSSRVPIPYRVPSCPPISSSSMMMMRMLSVTSIVSSRSFATSKQPLVPVIDLKNFDPKVTPTHWPRRLESHLNFVMLFDILTKRISMGDFKLPDI